MELGRHTGVGLERRVCTKCNLNSLEDGTSCIHVLSCPAETNIVPLHLNGHKNFHQLDGEQQFIWLMSNEDIKVMSKVTKFVTTILQPNE